jgi:DNA-binding GntR family transcriptional regulator
VDLINPKCIVKWLMDRTGYEIFKERKICNMAIDKKGNLSQFAADYVRQEILQGRFKHKEKIVEQELAEKLGMSRGPVREALKILMHEGFVEYEANKGCTVTLLSPKEAYEIFFLRGSLEKIALELCDGHLLKDCIFLMEEALEGMICEDELGEMPRLVSCDELFHKQILKSGQMERLIKLWESMSPMNGAMFLTARNSRNNSVMNELLKEKYVVNGPTSTYEIHKELLEVIKMGDLEKSKQALDNHYQATGERIYRIGMKMENKELFFS